MLHSNQQSSYTAVTTNAPMPRKRHTCSMAGFATILLTALMLLGNVFTAQASHYRYGNMSWSRATTSSTSVTFVLNQAWRTSFFSGQTVAVGQPVTGTVNLDFGDGNSQAVTLTVTSVNAGEDYFTGTATIVHNYASLTTYTASYNSSARLSALVNNGNAAFGSTTIVNLGASNLASPSSTLPVIVNVPTGQAAATFSVPAFDVDNTTMTYRLSTSAEYSGGASGTLVQPTGLSINSTTGVATFVTTGLNVGDLYNGAFTITDASGATSVVDFIMKIVNNSNPPQFDFSVTPVNNYVYNVNPGQNVAISIKATDPDAGDHVSFTAAGIPSGATFSPSLPTTPATTALTDFSWTPTIGQIGSYVVTFIATDDVGVQTTTSVTINVNSNPVFVSPTPTENTERLIITGNNVTDVIKAQSPSGFNTQILSVSGLPAGATVTPTVPTAFGANAQVSLSWTPTAGQFGPHVITFVAQDANNATTSYSYTLTANTIPAFTSTPVTAAYTCTPYTYNIKYADADSASGDVLLYEHSSLPYWMTFTDNHDGSGVLSGTPPVSENGMAYIISFTAADLWHHASPAVTQTFTVGVGPETVPPTFTAPGPVVINGWCGAGIPAGLVTLGNVSAVADNCTTTQTPTNNAPAVFPVGNTTVTWTVKDAFDNTATHTQLVTVNPAVVNSSAVVSVPYTVSGQEIQSIYLNYPAGAPANQSQTITVAATGGTNSYTYAWEKSTANSATLDPVNGNATNSYTFAPGVSDISGNDDNIFTFKATITDTHGCVSTQTKKINVVNPWVSGGNVQICHKVAVRGASVSQLMTVPLAQLAVHLGHYDGLGNCATFNGNKSEPQPMAPAQEVAVYPNPSTGMFVLEISYVTEPADIIVTDIQGRVVSSQKVAPTDQVSVSTIDLTSLAKGMYLVLVKEGDFRYQSKLVVR